VKAVSLVSPIGAGIGSALLIGFALFLFLLSRRDATPIRADHRVGREQLD